jgi:hypothetical protein
MKSAREVFDQLVHRAYWWAQNKMPSSIRNHTADSWEPGKMLEKISEEDRQILKGLTADQISEDKINQDDIYLTTAYSSYYGEEHARMIKEEKLKFDTKLGEKEDPRPKKY